MNKNKKYILIVGGSGTIGRNLINYFLKKEHFVINLDRNPYLNQSINYRFIKVDITNKNNLNKKFEFLKKNFEKIDTCINLFHFKGGSKLKPHAKFFNSFEDYSFKIWKETIDTNLNSLFLICQHMVKIFKKNKSGGTIVNTSSTYGINSPNHTIYGDSGINSPISYATTKGAIINFSKYLATYYAREKIRVNVVCPGGIQNKNQSKEFIKKYSKITPMKRLAKEHEFNEIYEYLSIGKSDYVTGAIFTIDGGFTAW
jgi:NAD(P)-dependent dehydrogenase (short-subunit alcohol dehydrogenase family)